MPEIQILVRPARMTDVERIMRLRQHARRVVMQFGYEDLVQMVKDDGCVVADAEGLLWGFSCTASYQKSLAMLRGIGLLNGWRIDEGLAQLLLPLERGLRARGELYLMHLAVDTWLTSPLVRQGFVVHDYIIHFERAAPVRALTPEFIRPAVKLRSLSPAEIDALTLLDHQAFDWPWQFSSSELIKWLMTADRLVALEEDGQLVGYSCVQVHGQQAQIVRLAILPQRQGLGYGRYLLADALDFAAQRGVNHITLNTQWHNETSQRLYQGFGFRAVGRRIPVLIKKLG